MKVSFLFWNLRGQQAVTLPRREAALLASMANFRSGGVQVFLFAECGIDPVAIVAALNADAAGTFAYAPSQSHRVEFFSNLGPGAWVDVTNNKIRGRITAQELQAGSGGSRATLIVGAHLDSANVLEADDRAEWARQVAADIRELERDLGYDVPPAQRRTVLVGDLNMNPFDGGLVQTTAFHAVMSKNPARTVTDLKARRGYPCFYNPTWSCLGDRLGSGPATRPPGSHYFSPSKGMASRFWHLYDQLLLRPALMDDLQHLEIPASAGAVPLVTAEGRPRSDSLTDHLPLRFDLNL